MKGRRTSSVNGNMKKGQVDYDKVLAQIGQFGPWQKRIHFLLWFISAASGLAVVVFSFTAYNAGYRCKNPYCDGTDGFVANGSGLMDYSSTCKYYSIGEITNKIPHNNAN